MISHLVVFDVDGTLTDTNLVAGECYWRAVCEVLGIAGEQPDWSTFRHVTDAGIATELCLRHLGRELASEELQLIGVHLVAELETALVSNNPAKYQIPGSGEVLSMLRESSDIAVALATGGLQASAELKLRHAGLPFSGLPLASSTDAISREDIVLTAARRAAEEPRSHFTYFTYVGDGVWDVRAARELGWRFIGVGSGEQAIRLRNADAEIVIPDYRPAKAFLELLTGGLAGSFQAKRSCPA